MNIILFGAPGSGKGTQAEAISDRKLIPAISTGNIIRDALKSGSEVGLQLKGYMASGGLVPDEFVIEIIKGRIAEDDCKNGFILDGFPRTIPQAEALDRMGVRIDKVIEIDVSDAIIIDRMSGRRVCETCGSSYHLENKRPREDGICDKCHGTLVQREDDHPDTVRNRLKVYHEQTKPLEEYYRQQGKLTVINGDGKSIDETIGLVLSALEA